MTISGSYHCFEEKGYVRPARVEVYIHPPIETKNMERKEASNLAAGVEEIIRKKLLELQAVEAQREGE